MNKNRQRQVRLRYDLILNLAAIGFGVVGLAFVAYSYFTPELRDKPFDTSLEGVVGHSGTFLLLSGLQSVFMLVAGMFFAWQAPIRLMRNKAYLEGEEPPLNPYR